MLHCTELPCIISLYRMFAVVGYDVSSSLALRTASACNVMNHVVFDMVEKMNLLRSIC